MTMVVVTSSLSLARELWRYGEPELATAAADLSAEDVLAVGKRAGFLVTSGDAARLRPNGPSSAAVMLAAVERLEGRARPCRLVDAYRKRGCQSGFKQASKRALLPRWKWRP